MVCACHNQNHVHKNHGSKPMVLCMKRAIKTLVELVYSGAQYVISPSPPLSIYSSSLSSSYLFTSQVYTLWSSQVQQCSRSPHSLHYEMIRHPLELIHSDICGPMPERSLGGSQYFITFLDDCTQKARHPTKLLMMVPNIPTNQQSWSISMNQIQRYTRDVDEHEGWQSSINRASTTSTTRTRANQIEKCDVWKLYGGQNSERKTSLTESLRPKTQSMRERQREHQHTEKLNSK